MNPGPPPAPETRRTGLAFVLIAALWLVFSLGYRPLTSPDEGRYVGVAYAMLQSGDWLVPRLNGLPFFHKPPLFYWLCAVGMHLFGVNEWAARLPSFLGALLGASALFWFLRRHTNPAQAGRAALILCTMPFFYVGAQFANLDMLVAGCISAAILAAADAALSRERGAPWRAALACAFIAAALGLLAKGLIGLLLPAVVFALWALLSRRANALRMAGWLPGWLLLVVIAAPWFVAMQMRYPAFLDYFVITQHFRRFASSGFNNEHPAWFYVPVIIVLCLPWSVWLLRGLQRVRAAQPLRGPESVDLLMLAWLLTILVFFSLPRSKLIGYVLPALPPLAALLGRAFSAPPASSGPGPGRALRGTSALAALLCLACVGLAARFGTPPDASLPLPPGEAITPGDRVVMLDSYFYGLPFYWRMSHPVVIASDWRSPTAQESDNWRKELADAARFDDAAAARWLQAIEDQPARLCEAGRTWVIGPSNAQLAVPWVGRLKLIAFNARIAVWRHDPGTDDSAAEPDCLTRPGPTSGPGRVPG